MSLELDLTANGSFELYNLRGLPTAYDGRTYLYQITRWHHDGRIEATSRAEGNGSVRNYEFKTLNEAFTHAMAWGKRQLKRNEQTA